MGGNFALLGFSHTMNQVKLSAPGRGPSPQRKDGSILTERHRPAHYHKLQAEIIDRRLILAEVNGELVKAADYYFHARKLNTACRHAQDLPNLFLLSFFTSIK